MGPQHPLQARGVWWCEKGNQEERKNLGPQFSTEQRKACCCWEVECIYTIVYIYYIYYTSCLGVIFDSPVLYSNIQHMKSLLQKVFNILSYKWKYYQCCFIAFSSFPLQLPIASLPTSLFFHTWYHNNHKTVLLLKPANLKPHNLTTSTQTLTITIRCLTLLVCVLCTCAQSATSVRRQ